LAVCNTIRTNIRERHNRFFRRARLHIQHNEKKFRSIYAPARTYPNIGISRKYLRIYVRNKGKEVATNCEARLIVIRAIGQQSPAIEEVVLGWEGIVGNVNKNIQITHSIDPKSRQLLHVVFSDSTFPTIQVDPPNPIHAVISSKATLDSFINPRIIEHGLVPGQFIVKINVISENANCYEYFKINVDNQWDMISMKKLSWFEKRKLNDDS
jgi:hypothetical protein